MSNTIIQIAILGLMLVYMVFAKATGNAAVVMHYLLLLSFLAAIVLIQIL